MAKRNVEQEIERLGLLREAPAGEACAALRKALADRVNLVVAKAAKVAAETGRSELVPDLLCAFEHLMEDAAARDPQCWGKNAIVKALVALDHRDSAPYARGARHIQMEAVWGGQEDTAQTLRGTCLLALPACTDLGRERVLRHLVDGLTDAALPVRIEAVRALEQMAGDEAALLLRLKAATGDREARVTGQAFDSLLNLEGESALDFVARFLAGAPEETRDEAALALGASRMAGAADRLRDAWTRERDPQFRAVLLRAVSLTRQPAAIEFLLDLLRNGRARDRADALEALGIHRDSPEIWQQVEKTAENEAS
jgi:hypothetical protein